MAKVVMFSHQDIEENGLVSGPSQRLIEIAKALQRKGHKVEVAVKAKDDEKGMKKADFEGVSIIEWDLKLERNIERYDAAILQIQCNDHEFLERISRIPVITDVSTPLLIELMETLRKETFSLEQSYWFDEMLLPLADLVQSTDLFLCGSRTQMVYYLGVLSALGRLLPVNYDSKMIKILYGSVPKEMPKHDQDIFDLKKKIVLFPGGLYPWIDAESALNAFDRDDSVLVFLGYKNPRAPKALSAKADEFMKKAGKKIGNNVFFKEWLEYDKRHNAYLESSVALITHNESIEAELSFRTRALDCLWCRLPVIISSGGEMSKIVEDNNLGLVLKNNSAKEINEKLSLLLEDDIRLKSIKKNISEFVEKRFNWDSSVAELHEFLGNPKKDNTKKLSMQKMMAEKNNVIALLREKVKDISADFDSRNREIADKEKDYEARLQEKHRLLGNMERDMQIREIQHGQELGEREKRMQHLENEILRHQKIIQNIEAEKIILNGKADEIRSLFEKKIDNKDSEMQRQAIIIEKLNSEILALHNELKDKDRVNEIKIEKVNQIIENKNKEILQIREEHNSSIKKIEEERKKLEDRSEKERDSLQDELKKAWSNVEHQIKLKEQEVQKHQQMIERVSTERSNAEKARLLLEQDTKRIISDKDSELKKAWGKVDEEVKKHQKIISHLEEDIKRINLDHNTNINRKDDELKKAWEKVDEEVKKHQKIIFNLEDDIRGINDSNKEILKQKDEELKKAWSKVEEEVKKHQKIIFNLEDDIKKINTGHKELLKQKDDDIRRINTEHKETLTDKSEELKKAWAKVDEEIRKHQDMIARINEEVRVERKLKEEREQEIKVLREEMALLKEKTNLNLEKQRQDIHDEFQKRFNEERIRMQGMINAKQEELRIKELELRKTWQRVEQEAYKYQRMMQNMQNELEKLRQQEAMMNADMEKLRQHSNEEIRRRDEHILHINKEFHVKDAQMQDELRKKQGETDYLKYRLKDIFRSRPYKVFNGIHNVRHNLGLLPKKKKFYK